MPFTKLWENEPPAGTVMYPVRAVVEPGPVKILPLLLLNDTLLFAMIRSVIFKRVPAGIVRGMSTVVSGGTSF
jgi:hypothetical protein